jgi:hypothetical protein
MAHIIGDKPLLQDYEHIIIVKDLFLLSSGLLGTFMLLVIYIKNLGLRFRPIYTRESDPQALKHLYDDIHSLHWCHIAREESFFLKLSSQEGWTCWEIKTFSAHQIPREKLLSSVPGEPWFIFAKNREDAENLIDPIVKKILTKYRKKFDNKIPIEVVTLSTQNESKLYTWLKTETHIRSAIFTFLDEILYICNIANVEPGLKITHTHEIHFEISIPHNKLSQLVHEEIQKNWGLEVLHETNRTVLKLWIAFSPHEVPLSIAEHHQMRDHYRYSFLHLKKTALG